MAFDMQITCWDYFTELGCPESAVVGTSAYHLGDRGTIPVPARELGQWSHFGQVEFPPTAQDRNINNFFVSKMINYWKFQLKNYFQLL